MQRVLMMAVLSLAALVVAGCKDSTSNYSCPDIAHAGIFVTIVDSVTQSPAGRNASVVAKSATFTDSVSAAQSAASDGPFGVVYSRHATGTYTLTVKQSGYRDWIRTGIVVAAEDQCTLHTVGVAAKLQK